MQAQLTAGLLPIAGELNVPIAPAGLSSDMARRLQELAREAVLSDPGR
jgi:hypothetical protein